MTHSHRYRRLFASDLLKVDKDTKNLDYTNYRANQLNQIHKLVIEKPKVIKEKVVRQEKDNTIQEEPQPLRRSTRERKEKKDNDYVY